MDTAHHRLVARMLSLSEMARSMREELGSTRMTSHGSRINKEIKLLNIFKQELPDPECLLFGGPVFWKFSELPAELRLRIWNNSMAPRLVTVESIICVEYVKTNEDGDHFYRCERYVKCKDHAAPVLHVNAESRTEALNQYKPIMKRLINGKQVSIKYVHPKLDTVVLDGLGGQSDMMMFNPEFYARIFEHVQNFQWNNAEWAAAADLLTKPDNPRFGLAATFGNFKSLKTLIIQFPKFPYAFGKFSAAEMERRCRYIQGLFREMAKNRQGMVVPDIIASRVPGYYNSELRCYVEVG